MKSQQRYIKNKIRLRQTPRVITHVQSRCIVFHKWGEGGGAPEELTFVQNPTSGGVEFVPPSLHEFEFNVKFNVTVKKGALGQCILLCLYK